MKKFFVSLLMTAFIALPAMSMEQQDDAVEEELQSVSIALREGSVKISGAMGQKLEIYNLAGVKVSATLIENDETSLKLNLSRGCYILKVGKVVRKVNIK